MYGGFLADRTTVMLMLQCCVHPSVFCLSVMKTAGDRGSVTNDHQ